MPWESVINHQSCHGHHDFQWALLWGMPIAVVLGKYFKKGRMSTIWTEIVVHYLVRLVNLSHYNQKFEGFV